MTKENQRDILIDVIRGFAIILVVLGHCIQEGNGTAYSAGALYFQNRVYQFIYAFHMPLLMMISGYVAYYSIGKISTLGHAVRVIRDKAVVYLLPAFFWDLLDQVRICILNFQIGYGDVPHIFMRRFLTAFLTHFWYLWAVFIFFCYVLFFHFCKRIRVLGYILTFLLMFVTPDGLGLGVYKFLLPYYLLAYHAHQWMAGRKKERDTLCVFVTGVFFWILFLFYQERDFIYLTGYKLLGKNIPEQILIDAYRFLIGLAGSLFFILVFKVLYQRLPKKYYLWLSYLGKRSLGIYLLSGYITVLFMPGCLLSEQINYAFTFLQSVYVLLACCIIIEVVRKIPILKRLVGEK